MNHSRFLRSFYVISFALAAATLVPRAALAADPSLDAQMQLGHSFDACEEKNAPRYFELRDFAFSVDPALKGWSGSVQHAKKKRAVPEWLARCDKEMTPLAAKAKRDEELRPLYRELANSCQFASYVDDAAFERWKAARAAYVAKAGNDDPQGTRAKCDVEMPKKHDEVKKKAADIAATQAQWKAEAERDRLAKEKRAKIVASIKATITGDRLKVLEKRGWPADARGNEERARKAPVWAYDEDVYMGTSHGEEESVEHTARCTIVFQFTGDKLTKTGKAGPGCR